MITWTRKAKLKDLPGVFFVDWLLGSLQEILSALTTVSVRGIPVQTCSPSRHKVTWFRLKSICSPAKRTFSCSCNPYCVRLSCPVKLSQSLRQKGLSEK